MENCVAPGLDEFDVIIRSCIVFSQSMYIIIEPGIFLHLNAFQKVINAIGNRFLIKKKIIKYSANCYSELWNYYPKIMLSEHQSHYFPAIWFFAQGKVSNLQNIPIWVNVTLFKLPILPIFPFISALSRVSS